MSNRIIGDYVVIKDGEVFTLTEPVQEIINQTVGGLDQKTIDKLAEMTKEQLLSINDGKLTVFKNLGYYIEDSDFYAESVFTDAVGAQLLGYQPKTVKYHKLLDMVVPKDKSFTIVWG